MAVKAKELRYAVGLSTTGELTDENGVAIATPPEWSAEHLLLAALVRCLLKSLRHHARRRNVEVSSASGAGRTVVTRRESDGRYAMVETEVEIDVELEPEPGPEALTELLVLAKRDCFVGSSLTVEPSYRWTVNGREAAS